MDIFRQFGKGCRQPVDNGVVVLHLEWRGRKAQSCFGGEGLLLADDVKGLTNAGRVPVVAGLTCAVNRFEIPGFVSLGETLVLEPNGGAVAVWAPSGLSYNQEAMILNKAFFQAVFQSGEVVLGEAVLKALEVYGEEGQFPFMLDIYNILGDPAVRMR